MVAEVLRFFRPRQYAARMPPAIVNTPTGTPTAMPIVAPVERPPEPCRFELFVVVKVEAVEVDSAGAVAVASAETAVKAAAVVVVAVPPLEESSASELKNLYHGLFFRFVPRHNFANQSRAAFWSTTSHDKPKQCPKSYPQAPSPQRQVTSVWEQRVSSLRELVRQVFYIIVSVCSKTKGIDMVRTAQGGSPEVSRARVL